MAVGKSEEEKRKKNKKTKITTHKKQTPYTLLTLETLIVIVLPAEKSEKNEKVQQRSGEGTESPTVRVDEKVASDQMKMHTWKHEAKGSSHGSIPCSPRSEDGASDLQQHHALEIMNSEEIGWKKDTSPLPSHKSQACHTYFVHLKCKK